MSSSFLLIRSKVKFTLENLSSQERVNEDEEEHETGDVEEIHEWTPNDTHNDLHWSEGSQKTRHS